MLISIILPAVFAACAQLSISPQPVQPSDPAVAAHAIEAEPVPPNKVMVRDFEVSPSSVRENSSPLHRFINLFRQGSPEEYRLKIGRAAAASLSEQTLKRLNKLGLGASRIPGDKNVSMPDNNILLVTGRLINANEGNRLTRIALGGGAGESSLDTEVHVFRVAYGERAKVLAFTTHADSGKMPGLLPSMGVGELFVGTITILAKAKGGVSTGQKIYSSQIDHLASRTGDEVARYLSQYAAQEGWIPRENAQSVRLAAD
ncbi:MAG: DUF4410 domain-containing protein [Deltaproteobacteria bacterium]|nr:DUF4410 domain-containing protein [Deltaproteobacteria bacterium]